MDQDSSCGAPRSGEAANRDCAERCIKEGAKPVLVTDETARFSNLRVFDAKGHMRHKVIVTGDLKGEVVTVKSIGKAD